MSLYEIHDDEVRLVLLGVLDRATRDLFILPPETFDFVTAYHFLFDPNYEIYWDERDENGEELPHGCYIDLDIIMLALGYDKEYWLRKIKSRLWWERNGLYHLLFPDEDVDALHKTPPPRPN